MTRIITIDTDLLPIDFNPYSVNKMLLDIMGDLQKLRKRSHHNKGVRVTDYDED